MTGIKKLMLVDQEASICQKLMALSGHSLGKYVSKLKISGNMQNSDNPSIHSFPNRMAVHFNMLCSLIKKGMVIVLSPWRGVGLSWEKSSSTSKPRSQTVSEQATNIARYSDSVEDLDMHALFLLFQEIKESPRNMQHPVTKRQVLKHPTQSASLNATRWKGVPTGKNNAQLSEPQRYQMIWQLTAKCRWHEDCIN